MLVIIQRYLSIIFFLHNIFYLTLTSCQNQGKDRAKDIEVTCETAGTGSVAKAQGADFCSGVPGNG